eukprot:6996180-Alexandrium_andersonii.AAC.1
MPHLAGRNAPLVTCYAHGCKRGTRRDFFIVSADVLPWVSSVSLEEDAQFDVHVPLLLELRVPLRQCCRRFATPFKCVKPDQVEVHKWRELVAQR